MVWAASQPDQAKHFSFKQCDSYVYHYFTGIQTLFHQQQYEDVSLDHGQRLSRTTYTLQKTVGTTRDSGGDPC